MGRNKSTKKIPQTGKGIGSYPYLGGNVVNRHKKSRRVKKKKFKSVKYNKKRTIKHTKPAEVTGVFKPSKNGLQSKIQPFPPTGIVRTDFPLTEKAKELLRPQMLSWTK